MVHDYGAADTMTEMSVRDYGLAGTMAEMSISEPLRVGSRGRALGSAWPTPKSHVCRWSSARRGRLGLAGLLSGGLLIAVSAGRTGWLLPSSVRPVPGSLAGVFGHGGIDLELGGLIAVLGLMFGSYTVAIRAIDQLSARAVLISAAALTALMLLAPPLLSTDVFSYVAYGRIGALYGANPYVHGPSAFALDPSYPFIAARW